MINYVSYFSYKLVLIAFKTNTSNLLSNISKECHNPDSSQINLQLQKDLDFLDTWWVLGAHINEAPDMQQDKREPVFGEMTTQLWIIAGLNCFQGLCKVMIINNVAAMLKIMWITLAVISWMWDYLWRKLVQTHHLYHQKLVSHLIIPPNLVTKPQPKPDSWIILKIPPEDCWHWQPPSRV